MAFTDIVAAYPVAFIIFISLVVTIVTTLVYKKFTNQHELKELKERLSTLQKKMREDKNDSNKMLEIQKELAEKNIEYMKHSFKPMFITFIPLIIVFWWLSGLFNGITGGTVAVPLLERSVNWIWIYIIFSLIFSLILRKVMKIY